jgi:hypothetical protein
MKLRSAFSWGCIVSFNVSDVSTLMQEKFGHLQIWHPARSRLLQFQFMTRVTCHPYPPPSSLKTLTVRQWDWNLQSNRDASSKVSSSTYLLTYLLTHSLTHSMVQDIIWKADCYSARQKTSRFLMEPKGSSPCSQKPATGPYPEPAESSSPHRSLSPQGPS